LCVARFRSWPFVNPMLVLEIIALAVVQGIAEFLPISSSGHLVVVADLFEQCGYAMHQTVTVNIVLHVGTLGAILVFYWRRIGRLLGQDRRVIRLLLVGTLPAVAVGLPVRYVWGAALGNTLLTGCMFLLTGFLLVWTARLRPGAVNCRELGYRQALLIGAFQALAVLPGVSRSGATIATALGCGLKRDEAAAFSFLLAIPAIGGAGVLEIGGLFRTPANGTSPALLVLGAALSFAVGLASLTWLVCWLEKGRLHRFAWWVFPLGLGVILWKLCCP
jgi:undecaprenyl-diphosphatase